jgi:hypothetical protein
LPREQPEVIDYLYLTPKVRFPRFAFEGLHPVAMALVTDLVWYQERPIRGLVGVYVLPSHRRWARQLWAVIERSLKADGMRYLYATILDGHTRGKRFARRIGFEQVCTLKAFVVRDEILYDAGLWMKELT